MIPVPPAVLEELAHVFGLTANALSHFGGGRQDSDGIVYAYSYQETRRLLKVMAIPQAEQRRGLFQLDERLRFMRFLGENDASVVFPILSPQGNLYETHTAGEYLWVSYGMPLAGGESKAFETWDEDLFGGWGQVIGRMHRLAQQYPSWEASVEAESGHPTLTWHEEWQGFYQGCQDEQVKQKWVEIGERLRALPCSRDGFGFIHNDPHIANLLADGEQVTMIDFDVANHHWFINDIAIACQSILFAHSGGMDRPVVDQPKLMAFLHCFFEGYERENRLAGFWLQQLDLFLAYRRILLFIVMHGWIESQAEMHRSWKQMIVEQPEIVGKEFVQARRVRYQGAIIRDHHVLVVQHRLHADGRAYWLLPGGGREAGESEEECVKREMGEETGLDVRVERLLLAESPVAAHTSRRTYWCAPVAGEAQAGYEPEPEVAATYAIAAVRWLDLNDESAWGEEITQDRFTYAELKAIQTAFQATGS